VALDAGAIKLEERRLADSGRFIAVADHAQAEVIDAAEVAMEQRAKGGLAALSKLGRQLLIATFFLNHRIASLAWRS
jgi:hypothetical protein